MKEYQIQPKKTNKVELTKPEPDNKCIISDKDLGNYRIKVDKAVQEWKMYQAITERIINNTDYMMIKGKRFKKKSAWRKYAKAFNISTEIIREDIIKSDKGLVKEATFVIRATLPDGRFADGWGNCSIYEKERAHRNHDIPATAATRATNRAISDIIGSGDVSSNEIL